MTGELREQPLYDLHRMPGHHRVHREEVGPPTVVLLPGAGADPDLVDALGRHDVHHAGEGRGVVVALAEELLAQVRMSVEMEDPEVGERRAEHLDDRDGGGVVAAQHERDEPRTPPGGHLLARGVELLAGRGAVGKLAVTDVGDRQILEVARERGRVRLDRLRAEPDVERARVGALAEVHPALERNAEDDDAGVSERKAAADERRRYRAHESLATLAARRRIASGNYGASSAPRGRTRRVRAPRAPRAPDSARARPQTRRRAPPAGLGGPPQWFLREFGAAFGSLRCSAALSAALGGSRRRAQRHSLVRSPALRGARRRAPKARRGGRESVFFLQWVKTDPTVKQVFIYKRNFFGTAASVIAA